MKAIILEGTAEEVKKVLQAIGSSSEQINIVTSFEFRDISDRYCRNLAHEYCKERNVDSTTS